MSKSIRLGSLFISFVSASLFAQAAEINCYSSNSGYETCCSAMPELKAPGDKIILHLGAGDAIKQTTVSAEYTEAEKADDVCPTNHQDLSQCSAFKTKEEGGSESLTYLYTIHAGSSIGGTVPNPQNETKIIFEYAGPEAPVRTIKISYPTC